MKRGNGAWTTSSGAHFRDYHGMCPTALSNPTAGVWGAFAHHCWLSLSGHGYAYQSSTTHSQIFVGSPSGNTTVNYRYSNGDFVSSTTVLQGENFGAYAWSGVDGGGHLRRTHRYDIIGNGRHVGLAFVNARSAMGPMWAPAVW